MAKRDWLLWTPVVLPTSGMLATAVMYVAGGYHLTLRVAVLGVSTAVVGMAVVVVTYLRVYRQQRESAEASRLRLIESESALVDALATDAVDARGERPGAEDSLRRPVSGGYGYPQPSRNPYAQQSPPGAREPYAQQPQAGAVPAPPPYGTGPTDADGDDARVATGASARRLTLPRLWATTHARLDHYHNIATGQAERSFRNAQAAMGLGFAFLVVFVFVALNASTTAGSIVAGGLGAVSAGLAGFVSRTFVRSQEASAAHLRSYFDQPLELSRFLAAERLVADGNLDEDQRAEVLTALVQAMVSGPQQPCQDASSTPGRNGRL